MTNWKKTSPNFHKKVHTSSLLHDGNFPVVSPCQWWPQVTVSPFPASPSGLTPTNGGCSPWREGFEIHFFVKQKPISQGEKIIHQIILVKTSSKNWMSFLGHLLFLGRGVLYIIESWVSGKFFLYFLNPIFSGILRALLSPSFRVTNQPFGCYN